MNRKRQESRRPLTRSFNLPQLNRKRPEILRPLTKSFKNQRGDSATQPKPIQSKNPKNPVRLNLTRMQKFNTLRTRVFSGKTTGKWCPIIECTPFVESASSGFSSKTLTLVTKLQTSELPSSSQNNTS